ncbi:NADH-dependent flavin oxidoreductase nadA [Lachnellula arida]|uniref:NADH-dependent flavin oxidoreductase nadA n=1 Tax=Lachnellula arida TaxID=1316785 RepID=A0A8T9BA42_9HELO|nr:NADH-dependent flavin oxidoreductase nadA [Lachnellula arida]
MAENLAPGPDHKPNQKSVSAYGQWADGGWGMILTGNVQVSDVHLGGPGDVAIPSHASQTPSPETKEAWKTWAATCQRSGTPTIVQLCHPGRQSPAGISNRSFFAKTIAPSPVPLNFGPSILERLAASLLFGTPHEMTVEEISGEGGVVDQFVEAARQSFEAGFKGIELHGAHGYLLAQFLSPLTNHRTDSFGGTPAKRAEVVLRTIRAIRAATSPTFCIGIKLNSVDAATSESLSDVMAQIRLVAGCGIDFIEISGGSYENPLMMSADRDKEHGAARELFPGVRAGCAQGFPRLVLMVTGGFRTRIGMEQALESGGCDLIGIGRPATVKPKLPKEIILNTRDVPDERASVALTPYQAPWVVKHFPLKMVGLGASTMHYGAQIKRMGDGLEPVDR